jgi:hypothetical protein
MKIHQTCFISVLFCSHFFATWAFSAQEENVPQINSMMNKRVTDFTCTNITMRGAIQLLRGKGGRVLFEELNVQRQGLVTNAEAIHYTQPTLTLSLHGATVEEILKALFQASPMYTYTYHQSVDMVSVFPKSESVLNWTLETFVVEKTPILSLVRGKDDLLGLRKHNVLFAFPGSGRLSWLDVPVTMNQTNVSVRECLAQICANVTNVYYDVTISGNKLNKTAFVFCCVAPEPKSLTTARPVKALPEK